jgi:hypothetical protein
MRTFMQVRTRVAEVDRDGDTVRYHLEDDRGPHELRFDSPFELEASVISLSATVERTGLVRRIVLRYALRHDNETVVVRDVLRIDAVGNTTVTRPPWVDGIVAETAQDVPAATSERTTDRLTTGGATGPRAAVFSRVRPPRAAP